MRQSGVSIPARKRLSGASFDRFRKRTECARIRHALLPIRQKVGEKSITLRQISNKIRPSKIQHALLAMCQKAREKSSISVNFSSKFHSHKFVTPSFQCVEKEAKNRSFCVKFPSKFYHHKFDTPSLQCVKKARWKSITFRQISIKIRPSKIRHALLAMRQIGARSDLLILSNWVRRRASPLARLGWLGRHYQKMSSKSRRYGVAMHQNPSKIATTQNDKLHRKASEINIEKGTLRCCNASKPVQNSVRNQLTVCRLPWTEPP